MAAVCRNRRIAVSVTHPAVEQVRLYMRDVYGPAKDVACCIPIPVPSHRHQLVVACCGILPLGLFATARTFTGRWGNTMCKSDT
jgi:hypothetical protein